MQWFPVAIAFLVCVVLAAAMGALADERTLLGVKAQAARAKDDSTAWPSALVLHKTSDTRDDFTLSARHDDATCMIELSVVHEPGAATRAVVRLWWHDATRSELTWVPAAPRL